MPVSQSCTKQRPEQKLVPLEGHGEVWNHEPAAVALQRAHHMLKFLASAVKVYPFPVIVQSLSIPLLLQLVLGPIFEQHGATPDEDVARLNHARLICLPAGSNFIHIHWASAPSFLRKYQACWLSCGKLNGVGLGLACRRCLRGALRTGST